MFKVGDKVKCINIFDNCVVNLSYNKTYTIEEVHKSTTLSNGLVKLKEFEAQLKTSRFIIDEDYYRRIKIEKLKERINHGVVR